MSDVTRPVLRWHGGKWRLAPWVISHFPRHRVYVEPFGGAASVLMRKDPSAAEVYNDLDRGAVNLFRVMQDPVLAARLIELLRLTPFARDEYRLACEPTDGPVEKARRLVIRAFMGFGSNAHNERGRYFRASVRADKTSIGTGDVGFNTRLLKYQSSGIGFRGTSSRTGFRAQSSGSNVTPAHVWANYPDSLIAAIERFRNVVVEHADAFKIIRDHDRPDSLIYCDPPYLPETRTRQKKKRPPGYLAYEHELTRQGHIRLLAALKRCRGMVVLSGYPSELYDARLKGWAREEVAALADGARPRTEVLWLNPACAAALDRERAGQGTPLFPYLEAAE